MDRHLLLDCPLHALQTDAELVLQQLTDGTNAAIAEMIDIIRLIFRRILFHLQDVRHNFEKVVGRQQRIVDAVALGFAHLDVELQTPNPGKVELTRIEEHRLKQPIGGLYRRRIARPHFPINLEQRIDRLVNDVLLQCLRNNRTHVITFREKHRELFDAGFHDFSQLRRRDFVICFEQNFAALGIHDVGDGKGAFELLRINLDLVDLGLVQSIERSVCNLLSCANNRLAPAFDIKIDLHADKIGGVRFRHTNLQAALGHVNFVRDVKSTQQVFIGKRRVLDRFFKL